MISIISPKKFNLLFTKKPESPTLLPIQNFKINIFRVPKTREVELFEIKKLL